MAVRIHSIAEGSLADRAGIVAGSLVLSLNGHVIHNFLELQYYSAEQILAYKLRLPNGEEVTKRVFQDWVTELGITPAEHRCRDCANNCIFCFIDQMPTGFRPTLNIKDDDYTFSFVYGNYVTLTNMSEYDFKQIVEMQLSPLYISVHTTNSELRKRMMRYKQDFDILEKLRYFTDHDIIMETQIVTVPGWNDGEELRKTLNDLCSPDLNIESIGVVPVGLTKYRDNLADLRPVNKAEAIATLELCDEMREKYDKDNIYCSDEFYIKAEMPIPEEEYYNGYPQIENGIGMIRLMLENWQMNKPEKMEELKPDERKLLFVTAELAYPFVKQIVDDINEECKNAVRIVAVKNEFFGDTVTVAGLLTANDVLTQIELTDGEIPVLPATMFSADALTIDNKRKEDFEEYWKREVIVLDSLLEIENYDEGIECCEV